jgi:hypothetical protein
MSESNTLDLVEVEDDHGRILTGAGGSQDSLEEVIDAHEERKAPVEPSAVEKPAEVAPDKDTAAKTAAQVERDKETGQFTKPTRGQRRFDQLVKEREEQKRRADQYEAELKELRSRPTPSAPIPAVSPAIESVTPAPKATPAVSEAAAAATPARQRPTPDEVGTKYQTWRDYEDDLFAWRDEQKAINYEQVARQVWQQQQAEQAFVSKVNEASAKGRQKYPDFDQKIHAPDFDKIWFPGPTLQAIAKSPVSEDIQYRLASDLALARRLAAEQDPIEVGDILAEIRYSLSGGSAASPASAQPPVVTPAPPPYQPVGGRAKSATPSLGELANSGDDYDKSGYREQRRRSREGR